MRKPLNEKELDQVAGGEVIVSDVYNKVKFTTLGELDKLKNCTPDEAYDYVRQLLRANSTMSEQEFDSFAKAQLKAKGWI